jgi:hypothetical protein
VTKDTTTLYAQDRDVFLFLDDAHAIEAGRLPNGQPTSTFAASLLEQRGARRSVWRASVFGPSA